MRGTCWVRAGMTVLAVGGWANAADAAIRVATYNVNDDTGLADHTANIVQAIEDMAARSLAGNSQRLDVISLQELRYAKATGGTPSVTLTNVVNGLNAVYGAGAYAFDPLIGDTTGNSTGNGPGGLIYNTKTIQVLSGVQIGTPDTGAAGRAPLRYQLRATGYTGANTFYLYDEHTKAYGDAASRLRRAYEVDAVRADADTLGSSAHVLYTGDFNLTGGNVEAAYQDLTAASGNALSTTGDPNNPNGTPLTAGVAQAVDPQTSTFSGAKAYLKYFTDASRLSASGLSGGLEGRLDLQLSTTNVQPSSADAGLHLVANTYTAFGNSYYDTNGNLATANPATGHPIDYYAASYNGTLPTGYTYAMLENLITASDHLPVLADYVIVVPEPGTAAVIVIAAGSALRRRRA